MSFFSTTQPTFKKAVRVASIAQANLNGLQTIDGVAVAAGDRVLLKDQANTPDNGIYNASSGAWTRATDFYAPADMPEGHIVPVNQGNTNARSMWRCMTPGPVTIGTTKMWYTRYFPQYNQREQDPWGVSTIVLGDNLDRELVTSTFTPTSGTLYLFGGMVLRAGVKYTTIYTFFAGTAAAGITGIWAGFVRAISTTAGAANVMIASTANTTAVPAVNGFTGYGIAGGYTPDYDTAVYVALSITATTMPNLAATPVAAYNSLRSASGMKSGSSNTGQGATPIAAGTAVTAPTAIAQNVYFCFA